MIPAGATGAVPAGGGPGQPYLEWKFSQVFGERAAGEEVQEGTTVAFLPRACGLCHLGQPVVLASLSWLRLILQSDISGVAQFHFRSIGSVC